MLTFLLLLLGGADSVDADYSYEKQYGETLNVRMWSNTLAIKFDSHLTFESVIFWKPGDSSVPVDSRRSVLNGYLEIKNLTQRDNGIYEMIGKNERVLKSWSLVVTAKSQDLQREAGEELRFTYPLAKDHCNIHFFPKKHKYELTRYDTQLVRSGRTVDTNSLCNYFEFVKPCGLELEMQESCDGYFEVSDQFGGVALNVTVDWIGEPFDLGYIGICVGSSLVSLICCCCVKRCCCKSSKKKDTHSPATEVAYNEYDHPPVVLGPPQPSPRPVTYYTAPPSQAPTGPLIHNPTIVNGPHAYSEVLAPAEPANAPAPSSFLLSDSGLQFELKGMNFPCAPPLSADPTYNSVYTSNKLDFL